MDDYYALLYGLSKEDLQYILNPQEGLGSNFPGETFRVLKEKEINMFGEFRTRRLILDAWDRLEEDQGVLLTESSDSRENNSIIHEEIRDKIWKSEVNEAKERSVLESKNLEREEHVNASEVEASSVQPMLTDFGLYKCGICGKMVMGYEKEKHVIERHGKESVIWRKLCNVKLNMTII